MWKKAGSRRVDHESEATCDSMGPAGRARLVPFGILTRCLLAAAQLSEFLGESLICEYL